MNGCAMVIGACYNCGNTFCFHPHKVPSIRNASGIKEPICKNCMNVANAKRKEKGLEPLSILPDAYAPCPEGEL